MTSVSERLKRFIPQKTDPLKQFCGSPENLSGEYHVKQLFPAGSTQIRELNLTPLTSNQAKNLNSK